MKKLAKRLVVSVLSHQVKRLRQKNSFTVIAVAGSVGKTSTKLAIANMLGATKKVRYQEGNYNDIISVPLVFFGLDMPSLFNPFAWFKVFFQIEKQLAKPFVYNVVVVELGTDGPGQIKSFGRYLNADIGVLTAIRPEHMEYFADIDAVAAEELAIAKLCKKMIVSSDLVAKKYMDSLPNSLTYSLHSTATYQLTNILLTNDSYNFSVLFNGVNILHLDYNATSEIQLYMVCAAIAVAHELDLSVDEITAGLKKIVPVKGRMNKLKGIKNSTILDDTYNASPTSTKAALDALYKRPAVQKIVILGNMNELGKHSADAHKEIGKYCNPKELELVVTIGPEANKYLAAAAEARGCTVRRYNNPYKAGMELQELIKPGCLILAKGSQNNVFAEEAVKLLLDNPKDSDKLVRQSAEWQSQKHKLLAKVT